MNVLQTKRTLMGLPPRKSVLIESNHGLGKSQVVAQTAAELSKKLGKPFGFIDMRLSQREVGDLIGMPRGMDKFTITHVVFKAGVKATEEVVAENVTIYDIPHWFPTDPDSSGFLFLDELNRATREVQQTAFELALDYRLNFRELPIGWRVISAINDNMDAYSVQSMDPALYDRFLKIKFRPTVPEWMNYAEEIGVHRAILQYVNKFSGDLDPPEKGIESGVVYPSRRSWVSLSDCIKYMKDNGDDLLKDLDYLLLLSKGYVGDTIAVQFTEFIRQNYKVYNAKDILDHLNDEMVESFKAMLVTEVTFYNKEIVNYISKEKVKLTKKQSENLFKYVKLIPKEAASGFWSQFTTDAREQATKWYRETTGVTDYIYGFLNKKMAMGEDKAS